jgi:hypothetical protein
MMTHRIASTCLILMSLCTAAPLSAQNPWAKVPALPTACYTKGEPFGDEVQKAIEEGEAAVAAQKETNEAAKAKLNELDMMTRQNRMTEFMRKNPAAAGQKMQEIAASGAKLQEAVREKEKGSEAMKEKWKAVEAQSRKDEEVYAGLLNQARAAFEPGSSNRAKAPALLAQSNEAYKTYCQKWFVEPTSPFLGYLAEYKTYLIEKEVAMDEQAFKGELAHFEVYGVPLNGFKSPANQEAAVKYLKVVDQIFRSRQEEPRTSP